MNGLRADVPVTPDRQEAQQLAQQELALNKYHGAPTTPPPTSSSPSPSPSPTPTPTQAAAHHASHDLTTLLVIALIVVFGIVLLLVLRKIGKPKRDKGKKKSDEPKPKAAKQSTKSAVPVRIEVPLTGAALHRYNAEQAAGNGDWQEAIRERFRAVIVVLDERGLLPERPDRTADEAARDAGHVLPEHAAALADAALAFDEVEYGEYAGSAQGYAVIRAVDEAVSDRDQAAAR